MEFGDPVSVLLAAANARADELEDLMDMNGQEWGYETCEEARQTLRQLEEAIAAVWRSLETSPP